MMKRKYEKPTLCVETLELDMPIALVCENDVDEVTSAVGTVFYEILNCQVDLDLTDGVGEKFYTEYLKSQGYFNS